MTRRSIEVNGGELTYLETGVNPPVILINGLLGDYRSWRRQVDVFRPNYRVLALSQRYYWPSKWPDDGAGVSVATHVADRSSLLRQLDLPPVHLIGHSYGGGVSAQFASEHPDLVRSLVLAARARATQRMLALLPISAKGHVWTTPALQEESDVPLAVGCKYVSGLFARRALLARARRSRSRP
jgi:pimeloyl-ACP methyl ester carboxylesterase